MARLDPPHVIQSHVVHACMPSFRSVASFSLFCGKKYHFGLFFLNTERGVVI